ncbi:HlyD family secretion protein [Clostridium ganghwense]|uniref:Efflux RND transporter periplasmic adaptor subunit n=1 Tax=Clostridium ganghwense TaxID=312089 RepID=A0ABT4CY39_9CLOT|nr:efflux RND transporter periplasmic adaptor subunit [Clostridium ganghwense]MCY6372809.1 efflux RND transporter periplasmic adaptor subunit [Clostridium ganghwense]
MKRFTKVTFSTLIIASLFTGCSSISSLNVTGEKLIKPQEQNLTVQGQVEAEEISINTKIPGNITKVKVSEGDRVKKGDVLVNISSDTLLAKKAQAEAAIAAATGQLKAAQAAKEAAIAQSQKAENGAQAEDIAKAKAACDFAQEAYNFAKDSYDRVHALYEQGIATKQQNDEASTKLKEVAMKKEVAKQTYDQALKGAREEDKLAAKALVAKADSMIQAAKGQVAQAQAASKEASTYIKDTVITAPADGVITTVNPKVGELVSTGMPLITISKTSDQWIEVKVQEKDLSMVSVGKTVTVKLPAYKDQQFEGTVVKINAKPDFATKRATNDNGEYDILSYGVKVKFTKMDKELHPGMTAFVDFGKKSDTKQETKKDSKKDVK